MGLKKASSNPDPFGLGYPMDGYPLYFSKYTKIKNTQISKIIYIYIHTPSNFYFQIIKLMFKKLNVIL